jgi:hypothetical protein
LASGLIGWVGYCGADFSSLERRPLSKNQPTAGRSFELGWPIASVRGSRSEPGAGDFRDCPIHNGFADIELVLHFTNPTTKNSNARSELEPAMEETLRYPFVAVLFVGSLSIFGVANAADGCGPGCHSAPNGGCVVDGWTAGAAHNECPVGAGPRRPCPAGMAWRFRACFDKVTKDG